METLVIEVSGGVVQQIYSDANDLRVVIVNWDCGESPGDAVDVGFLHAAPMAAIPAETLAAVGLLGR